MKAQEQFERECKRTKDRLERHRQRLRMLRLFGENQSVNSIQLAGVSKHWRALLTDLRAEGWHFTQTSRDVGAGVVRFALNPAQRKAASRGAGAPVMQR